MYFAIKPVFEWDSDEGLKIEIEGEKRFRNPENIQWLGLALKHLIEMEESEIEHIVIRNGSGFEFTLHSSSTEKEVKSIKDLLDNMGIEKVIFNENATIVQLTTGEKGVAVRSQGDSFDPVVGFSVAYALAEGTRGNKRQFHHLISSMYSKQRQKQKKKGNK